MPCSKGLEPNLGRYLCPVTLQSARFWQGSSSFHLRERSPKTHDKEDRIMKRRLRIAVLIAISTILALLPQAVALADPIDPPWG